MVSPRILIVDDESSIRLTLGANLELADFQVTEADSAVQALTLLREQEFDVVLSDILMPGMSGVSLYRQIRLEHPELPVVLMTAYALDEYVKVAITQGVFAVLPKPFDIERAVPLLQRASCRPRVLVLDEHPAEDSAAAAALGRAGVVVQVADRVAAAVPAMRAGEVDICVVDLRAGPAEVQGIVQQVRRAAPALELLLISEPIPAEAMAGLSRSGVRAFMDRPFSGAQLVEAVARLRAQAAME